MGCHTEFHAKALGSWDQKSHSIFHDWQFNMENTKVWVSYQEQKNQEHQEFSRMDVVFVASL